MNKRSILTKIEILCYALVLCCAAVYQRNIPQGESLAVTAEPEGQVTVVLDAGHGGFDGGAVGTDTGVQEAGINLAVTRLVAEGLEQAGLTVLLTRDSEEALGSDKQADMRQRKKILSAPEVDLVVSIHMNKFSDRSVSGPMVFYMKGSLPGQAFAECMVAAVCQAIGRPNRIANPGDYFVIRECSAPAVIVECGFLSNAADEALLQDSSHQKKLADGIVQGVVNYLKGGSA